MDRPAPTSNWDERYDRTEYVFGVAPNAFLKAETARLAKGAKVLAVADGEGRNGVWLAENGMRVHAVDSSSVAIEKARRLAAARGVSMEWEHADLDGWHWPAAHYDAVVAIFIQFADPRLRGQIFDGIKRTLKPSGLLLMEGYRPEQIAFGTGGPRIAENLYDETLLRTAFRDFEILDLRAYDGVLEEGDGHRGMSAVIDLVARKPA